MFQWLIQSSANPDKLAMTVRGLLLGLIPVALIVAKTLGLDLAPQDLEDLVVMVTAILSGVVTLFGLVRKVYFWFKGLKK